MALRLYIQLSETNRRPDGSYYIQFPECLNITNRALYLVSYSIEMPNITDSLNWYDEWYSFACKDGSMRIDSMCISNLSGSTINAASTGITTTAGSRVNGAGCFTIVPPHPVALLNSNNEPVLKVHHEYQNKMLIANSVQIARDITLHVQTNAYQNRLDRSGPPFQNCILEFEVC